MIRIALKQEKTDKFNLLYLFMRVVSFSSQMYMQLTMVVYFIADELFSEFTPELHSGLLLALPIHWLFVECS